MDPTIYARHGLRRFTVRPPGLWRLHPGARPDRRGHRRRHRGHRRRAGRRAVRRHRRLGRRPARARLRRACSPIACSAAWPKCRSRRTARQGVDFLAGMNEGNVIEFNAALAGEDALRGLAGARACDHAGAPRRWRSRLPRRRLRDVGGGPLQMAKHLHADPAPRSTTASSPGSTAGWTTTSRSPGRGASMSSSIRVPTTSATAARTTSCRPRTATGWPRTSRGAEAHVTDAGHMGDDATVEREMAWLAGRRASPAGPTPRRIPRPRAARRP